MNYTDKYEYFSHRGGRGGSRGGGRGGLGPRRSGALVVPSVVAPGSWSGAGVPVMGPVSPFGHGEKAHHHRHHRHRHHRPWLRPGRPGLAGRGWWQSGYWQPITYINVQDTSCGGGNCDLFWSESNKEYESRPGVQCTCCSEGKSCRTNNNPPMGTSTTLYNDCCEGYECKSMSSTDMYGICRKS